MIAPVAWVLAHPKTLGIVGGVALLGGGIWYANRAWDARDDRLLEQGARRERAQILADEVEPLRVALDSVQRKSRADSAASVARLARADSARDLAERSEANARLRLRAAEITVANAGATADATLDSLRASVPPVLVPLVDRHATQDAAERRARENVLALERERNAAFQAIIASADTVRSTLEGTVTQQQIEIAALQDVNDAMALAYEAELDRLEENGGGHGDAVVTGAITAGLTFLVMKATD